MYTFINHPAAVSVIKYISKLLSKGIFDGCKLISEICSIKSIHLNSIFTFNLVLIQSEPVQFNFIEKKMVGGIPESRVLKSSRDTVKPRTHVIKFSSVPYPLSLALAGYFCCSFVVCLVCFFGWETILDAWFEAYMANLHV